jgi:peptidoglycan/LPS O-acetylase OafA/YrhL
MTWSLAVEEQFYVVLPFLIRFTPIHLIHWLLGILVIFAPIFRSVLYFVHPYAGLPGYVMLPSRWDALFLGVLGAIVLRNQILASWLRFRLNWIRLLIVVGGLILFALLVNSQGIASPGMTFVGHTVLAFVSLGLILIALLSGKSLISRIFSNRYLVWLGTISYGVYLFHQPISGLLHNMLREQVPQITNYQDCLVTLLALTMTLLVAVISWRLFEQPIVRYGQQVHYKL